jgi:hypothetical protein
VIDFVTGESFVRDGFILDKAHLVPMSFIMERVKTLNKIKLV